MPAMKPYKTVDEYLANFSGETLAKLNQIRQTIRQEIPEAAEKISYGIPTFTLDGKHVIYFAGYRNHVSLYPVPPGPAAFKKQIKPFVAGKGTLRFPLDKPLPLPLIRTMTRLCVEARRK